MSCSVQVAVRVRPFNSREQNLKALCCIDMRGPQTIITNLEKISDNERKFTFDYSYWSHDGFVEQNNGYLSPAPGSRYADQQRVFNDLGKGVLDYAWQGYHACLFAYGQTGSGKSYSMVGYGENKGIIPVACQEIFHRISLNKDASKTYEVSVGMLEVYNEQIQDLLIKPSQRPKGGLDVRESKVLGIYVEGLSKRPVDSFKAIEKIVAEGVSNRSIGATMMNATSSRAHTVVAVELQQLTTLDGKQKRRHSVIYLVDLAGSEKNDQTQATGDRLKEGCAINKSLSALGNVISVLAEKAQGKADKKVIPYRDSKLTRLLQNALGGSCKTIMICALSPASSNYEETLSTLRYADRAKQVKNFAVVNEDPTERLIRELREENEKLKSLINGTGGMSAAEREKLQEEHQREIQAMQAALQDMEKSFQQKLQESEKNTQSQGTTKVDVEAGPHLTVLHEDPVLSGKLNFAFPKAPQQIWAGKNKGDWKPDVLLGGVGVSMKHCAFSLDDAGKAAVMEVVDGVNFTFVNGEKMTQKKRVTLRCGDRVVLGQGYAFLVVFPKEQKKSKLLQKYDYEGILEEVCVAQGDVKKSKPTEAELEEEKKRKDEYKKQVEAAQEAMKKQEKEFQEKMKAAEKANDQEKKKLEEEFKKKQAALDAQKKELDRKEMRRRAAETDRVAVENKLTSILPMIKEASMIAAELKKPYEFQPTFDMDFTSTGDKRTKVIITVKSQGKPVYEWTPAVMENRIFLMRDLLDAYTDAKDKDKFLKNLKKEDDPFWDPIQGEKCIGKSLLFLKALTAQLESEATPKIFDKTGQEVGQLKVGVYPVTKDGKELPDEDLKETPEELIGTSMHYEVRIESAKGLPKELANNVYIRFKTFLSTRPVETPRVKGANPNPVFNFKQRFEQPVVTAAFLEYLENEVMIFEIYGEDSRALQSK